MNILKKFCCVFLSWTLFVFTFPVKMYAQEKVNIAVLDMEGRGISALEAATLTDRLRSELVDLGVFSLVERGQMEMILEEQGFQQTGCTSAECAVEVGKLLGVQKMVAGSIGKIGALYTVDVRMFDVTTGKIERVSKREHRGDIEGLIDLLVVVSRDLAGIKVEDEKEEVAVKEEKPKKKGRKWLLWTVLLAGVGGGAAYYFSTQADEGLKPLLDPPDPPENP
ncbi:MAG: hypothetical protein IIA61_10680 [Candidatus Marinimicrobia bacterium]|nr:hypothetical protein [Candidatus Neomarinimicrobiota bacterium]